MPAKPVWSVVVLAWPFVVLLYQLVVFVCPFVVLVCPLVVSFCPLVVPVVLSVDLFITDLKFCGKVCKTKLKKKKVNFIITIVIKCAYISRILNMPQVLTMSQFRIWHNSGYARVLNMRALHSVLNMPEYTQNIVLNISWVLNMPGFWKWLGSEYAIRVTQGSKCATIWLNVYKQDADMPEFTTMDMVLNNVLKYMARGNCTS